MKNQRARILPPYTRRVDDLQQRIVKLLTMTALIMLAMFLGFTLAVFGIFAWWLPATVIVILALIALWMAPDVDTHLDPAITRAYFIFVGLTLMWPSYIAFNFAGLPWISFQRLAMFAVVAITLFALATSARVRTEMAGVLTSHTLLFRLFLGWVLVHAIMLPVGMMESSGRWVSNSLTWHFMFIVTAWLMLTPGNLARLHRLIIIGALVTSLLVIPEVIEQRAFWVDYIPPFLGIDPEIIGKLQTGVIRSGVYRAGSIYIVSVTYAEYIGTMIPYILLAIVCAPTGWRRFLAILMLAALFHAALATQSRSAMVGFTITIPTFAAMVVWRNYQRKLAGRDMMAPAFVSMIPAAAAAFAFAVLTVPRIRVRVLGGAEHAPSNAGREAQWDMAIPQIIKNPLGYGMGSIDRIVPYVNGEGEFTIDGYTINLLVEYGIPGFLLFVGFFITAIILGVQAFLRSESREEDVAGAAAIAIFSFLVSRTVLSSEGQQWFAFGCAGIIVAVRYAQLKRAPAAEKRSTLQPRYAIPARTPAGGSLGPAGHLARN